MQKVILYLIVFLGLSTDFANAQNQNNKDSSLFVPIIAVNYTFQAPSGDMDTRFGLSHAIGGTFLLKTKKNWVFGADWNYIFGKKVNEPDLMKGLINSDGVIVDKNGSYAQIRTYERGQTASLKIGRLFNTNFSNKNSGILVLVSVGGLQHKIRIDVNQNTVTALTKDYKKGYDRLSNGIAVEQFIGYMFLSDNRLINLFAGFESIQAFTKNRRSFNFDTMEKDRRKRFDMLTGIKAGITLPLYKRLPKEYYYN